MCLIAGSRAAFKCFDGKLITGKVVSVMPNHYVVIGDTETCGQYPDSLFRFAENQVVRIVRGA